MNRSESIGKLAAALAKAQAAMEGAIKDSKNPHYNSRYADLASVRGACQKPLADNELAVIQNAFRPEAGLVSMTTLLMHSSGEWIESDALVVQSKDAGPQAVISCITYLRRTQLAAIVGIAPEDDDAEAGEGRSVASQQTPRPIARAPMPKLEPRMPRPPNGAPEPPPLTDKDIPFVWLLALVMPWLG